MHTSHAALQKSASAAMHVDGQLRQQQYLFITCSEDYLQVV